MKVGGVGGVGGASTPHELRDGSVDQDTTATAVTAGAMAWTGRRIAAHITRRRLESRGRDAAWQTQCAVDTEAGNDTDDLHTCQQILDATETARKEKP